MYPKKYLSKVVKILMLDKEERLLEAIKTYFFIKNITVLTTTQLDVALSLLQHNLPDCIVIDIAMPNNVGFQFIQELKKDEQYQHVPFILLTTKGLTEDRIKGYNLGCSAYISKPFDPEELEAIIKNLIEKNNHFYHFMLETYVLIKDIRLLLSNKSSLTENRLKVTLTRHEQFILRELLIGKNADEIAFALQVSVRSIEKYISRILNKTKSKNTRELQMFSCLFL